MKFNDLAKKAARHGGGPEGGAMEVEDMIRFIQAFGAQGAQEIERLNAQHGWLMQGLQPDGTRQVPFGRWAQVCVAWGRYGAEGVAPLLAASETAPFAVGLLEDMREPEAAQALLTYVEAASFKARAYGDPGWSEWAALLALNALLSMEDGLQMSPAFNARLLAVLQHAWVQAGDEGHLKGYALYTLRGAVLPESLQWAESLKNKDADWERTRKLCVKSLKKRLASDYTPPSAEQKRQIRRKRAANE